MNISEVLNNSRVIITKTPMSLYHVVRRNTPRTREHILADEDFEMLDYYRSLPENDFPTALKDTKFFSIHQKHPIYYNLTFRTGDVAYLHYTTMKPMVLFDGRGLDKDDMISVLDFIEHNRPLCSAIDGWIIQDVSDDPWHEIALFEPANFINPRFEEMIVRPEDVSEIENLTIAIKNYVFPYGDEDTAILEQSILGTGSLSFDTKCIITTH